MTMPEKVKKRDGRTVKFDKIKITEAIYKAAESVDGSDRALAEALSDKVTEVISTLFADKVPTIEDIQDTVEKVLIDSGHSRTAKAFILYRKKRDEIRAKTKVRRTVKKKSSTTDQQLLVDSDSDTEYQEWDKNRIADALVAESGVAKEDADKIASVVEKRVIQSGVSRIGTSLIRELVNNELFERGYTKQLEKQTLIGMSNSAIHDLLHSKGKENSNISSNNPEAINLAIAENTIKQYMLQDVFSPEVGDAHKNGLVHIHDLGYPRTYCSGHSLEYIKKYGLDLVSMDTKSAPAKRANTLTGHLNTFLSSMQAYYAGALGLGAVNTFYSPYLEDASDDEILQVAQYMIFSGAQNCFSRGGQSLHPEELIWIKESGRYRPVRIGKYVDDIIRESTAVEASFDYEVVRTEDYDIQTISFDKSGKVSDKMVKYVARIPHVGKMYRLFTERGIVNITGDHSVFTYTGKGQIVPTKASELKVGDYVVAPHRINVTETMDSVDITEYLEHDQISIKGAEKVREKAIERYGKNYVKPFMKEFGVNGGYLKDGLTSDKIRFDIAKNFVNYKEEQILLKGDSQEFISPIIKLNYGLGYLAGMFCSEGHVAHKTAVISNRDMSLLDRVVDYLDSIGYNGHRRGDLDIYKNHKGEIRNCAHVAITGILGMFISKTCSENKEKKIPDWILTANQDCVDGFLAGFLAGDGLLTRDTWAASNTSTQVISGISFLLLRSGRESNVFESKVSERNPNWSDLYEIRESLKRTVNPFNDKRTTESFTKYYTSSNKTVRDAVEWLIDSDLSLARIRDIEEYTYTGYVYDISVPDTEAFLGGIGSIFFKNTLFLDFNLDAGVPSYLKDVPAIGSGGKYTGRNYASYEKTAHRMAMAMLRVWKEGDSNGHLFQFPKPNFHINDETFSNPDHKKVFDYACEVAAHNGAPYFAFDRDSASQSACCRLRFTIEDDYLLKHPEHQRFCGFMNVTVNLPQCAYRAGKGKIRKLYAEIDKAMEICLKAHLQKKTYVAELMSAPNLPLWQLGKPACDGKPYVELDKCTYIIGMIGLNECVQFLLGKELHEDEDTLKAGLRIISHMFYTVKEFGERHGLKFTLEESPAESASRRFARIDLKKFPESADVIKGDIEKDECYYTNSIHLRADCGVDLVQRITKQAKFHNLIESGAIIHAFVGENRPSAKAIAKLVEMTYRKTNAAQITISPEFTVCQRCKKMIPGMSTRCQSCGSENVTEAKRNAISPNGTWTDDNINRFKGG